MKKILLAGFVALAGFLSSNAQAQSTSGTFNVNITLTSACTLTAIADVDFAYTSFQAAAATATGGGFSVSCTNSRPYTFGLQAGNGAATPPGAATINVTDSAVNLTYDLALSAAGGTGTGAAQAYSVTGNMAAGQSGTCATATCTNAAATNRVHTLIVNF
ncbi:MAG: spore coat protein U domain-containing protein [Betaproteobacteria bacterium]|nr:spore coat protein U domain-containing protein [Betaproteobacteria bacterium]